jgi:riboflavin kinase/FMN adenylyltransferase
MQTFTTHQIKGKGRGTLLGFPTINLAPFKGVTLKGGVYAARVSIDSRQYIGALHYGPIPTFGEKSVSLEVFLLDARSEDLKGMDLSKITIIPIKKIRDIKQFSTKNSLVNQIKKDTQIVRTTISQKLRK